MRGGYVVSTSACELGGCPLDCPARLPCPQIDKTLCDCDTDAVGHLPRLPLYFGYATAAVKAHPALFEGEGKGGGVSQKMRHWTLFQSA